MVEQFAAPPVNPLISIQPLTTSAPGRDATNVQSQLAAMPVGTIIEGFVVGRDQQNNPIMRTPVGDLQMQSDVFVKTGSTLVIRVDATQDSRARIVSIDGLQPQDYAAQNSRNVLTEDTIVPSALFAADEAAAPAAAGQNPAATIAPTTQPQPPLSSLPSAAQLPWLQTGAPQTAPVSAPMQALFLNPPAAPAAGTPSLPPLAVPIAPALLQLQAGAALKVTLLQLNLPRAVTASAPAANIAPTGQLTASNPLPAQAASVAAATASPQPSSLPQAEIASPQTVRAAVDTPASPASAPAEDISVPSPAPTQTAATPPALPAAAGPSAPDAAPLPQMRNAPLPSPAPASAPPLPSGAMHGVVIGHAGDGGNIVQTQMGTLKVFTPTPLPVHTQLALRAEVENAPVKQAQVPTPYPANSAPADDSGDSALTPLSRDWDALDQLVDATGAAGNAPQMQAIPQAIPHADSPKLTSDLLFFLAAVKGGDLRQWMGSKNVDLLDARLPALAAKMKTDIGQMQQLFNNSPIEQWSGMLWPVMVEGQAEYARFYLRDEPEQKQGGKDKGSGREQRFIVEVELSHIGDMQFDGFVRQGTGPKQFDLMVRSARPLAPEMTQEIRQRFDTAMQVTGYKGYIGFQQGAQHFVRPLASGSAGTDPNTILA